MAWDAKEVVRSIYEIDDPAVAGIYVAAWPPISRTPRARPKSAISAARCASGETRSQPGTERTSRMAPPKP
jgi:hypothetical protein